MGYNLERLKKQYGLGSASKLGYAGASAPVGSIEGLEGEALRAFIEQQRRYDADMAAYNTYADAYGNRLTNTPMYANPQFAQAKRDPRESMNLTGNYYDDILAGPIAEGNAEVVGGGGGGGGISGGITGGGNIGNGVNGGGDGEGQRQRDAAAERERLLNPTVSTSGTSALSDLFNNSMYGKLLEGVSDVFGNEGQSYYETKLPPESMRGGAERAEYIANNPKPWWDQFTYARTPEEKAYNSNNSSFLRTGDGALVRSSNGNAVGTGSFGTRPLSYRAPGFGALKSATAGIPDLYNDAVALDRFPTSAYDGESALKEREDALSFVPNNLGGYQLGMGSMGNNVGTPYDAQEFSGTGMAMGNDFAPAPVAPAPVLVDPGALFLQNSQALSNKFNIPLKDLYDQADKISQQTTSNIQSVIPPSGGGGGGGGNNNPPAPSAPARGSTARSNRGPGRKGRQAAASNKSATSPSRSSGGYSWGLAEGGHINGYAMGGPEDQYEIEKDIVLNAPVPDVSLEADVIDESLSLQGLIDQQTTNATGAGSNTSEMLKMLKQGQVDYGDQISEQQGTYNTETQALKDMMIKMADSQSVGPSESEKWFRIAAAMGAPTKTGSFFENLGLTSEALGDISKERRAAQSAGDLVKMKAAEFSLGLLKDQLDSTKTMSAAQLTRNQNLQDRIMEWDQNAIIRADENIFNLMTIKEEREWEVENRKTIPQTAAGLAAEEAGYDKGTPDYREFVKAVVDREDRIKTLNIEALERKANSLTKPEIDARKEADKDIKSTEGAIKLLKEALELSPKSYPGDWYSVTKKALQGAINSDDQKYKDSERLENLLSQGALATLKATFGGNISDGERAANLEITGAKMKSEKSRTETIKLALETMREYEKEANDRLKDILSGDYVKRTKSTI